MARLESLEQNAESEGQLESLDKRTESKNDIERPFWPFVKAGLGQNMAVFHSQSSWEIAKSTDTTFSR